MILARNILFLLALAAFVSACGVRGAPELPDGVKKNHKPDEKTVLDKLI